MKPHSAQDFLLSPLVTQSQAIFRVIKQQGRTIMEVIANSSKYIQHFTLLTSLQLCVYKVYCFVVQKYTL